jgi:hypothetical protein
MSHGFSQISQADTVKPVPIFYEGTVGTCENVSYGKILNVSQTQEKNDGK